MAAITSQKIKRVIILDGKKQYYILTQVERKELHALIRRRWQNLIERQFKNEGEAIPGQRTGYLPWKDRAKPLPVNDDTTYTRRLSIEGKKETVIFSGRPLLQLSYPTLLTRYKRNVLLTSNGKGIYNVSIDFPNLSRGADAGVHQEGYSRKYIKDGVPHTGLPARKLNAESFRLAATKATDEYLTKERITRSTIQLIRNVFKPNRQGPFILKSDNSGTSEIPF